VNVMSDEELKEKVSLLVDDRLDPAVAMKVMKALESDPERAAVYTRYMLIGETLRSNGDVIYDDGFVTRLHQALEQEPRLVAPVWKSARRDRMVTLALAATLAGLAVLVGQTVSRQSEFAVPELAQRATDDETAAKPDHLDTYLVNHSGTAYLAANGGLLPYLRIVSHGTSR